MMNLTRLLAVFLLALSGAAYSQTIQLVTEEEAKLPPGSAKPPSRAITRGPGVKLVSPERVSGRFPLKIVFEPRGDAKIDVASARLEYLKGAGVDLTARLAGTIKPGGIDVPAATAPAGEHPMRASVRDSEGRLGSAEFKLLVK